MTAVKPAKQPLGRRHDVLKTLQGARSPMTIATISEALKVHPNTVRFHLGSLVSMGRVERVASNRKGPGRPALMFRATQRMDPDGLRRYRLLAEIYVSGLAGDQDAAARAIAAGRDWGSRVQQPPPSAAGTLAEEESIEQFVGLLDELGFAPDRPKDDQIELRHCPFLEVAEKQKAVVCLTHLGLMRGALETWQAPVTVERLDPFIEPDVCLVHLARRATAT
jgi:predicted ArsR family transcriptional regulator